MGARLRSAEAGARGAVVAGLLLLLVAGAPPTAAVREPLLTLDFTGDSQLQLLRIEGWVCGNTEDILLDSCGRDNTCETWCLDRGAFRTCGGSLSKATFFGFSPAFNVSHLDEIRVSLSAELEDDNAFTNMLIEIHDSKALPVFSDPSTVTTEQAAPYVEIGTRRDVAFLQRFIGDKLEDGVADVRGVDAVTLVLKSFEACLGISNLSMVGVYCETESFLGPNGEAITLPRGPTSNGLVPTAGICDATGLPSLPVFVCRDTTEVYDTALALEASRRGEALCPTASGSGGGSGGGGLTIVFAIIGVLVVLLAVGGLVVHRRGACAAKGATIQPAALHANPLLSTTVSYQDYVASRKQRADKMYEDPQQCDDTAELEAMVRELCDQLPSRNVTTVKMIGQGEFGEVFKCSLWTDNLEKLDCAAKTVHPGASAQDRIDFLKEAAILGQFQHENVLGLLGVCLDCEPHMIVTELCSLGDLHSHLQSHEMLLPVQTSCARMIARGMAYLAGKGFVHRDLAARNILLSMTETSQLTAKVADFGLSKELVTDSEYFVSEGGRIPIRWTAPEAIEQKKYTTSSDVWAFGVTLWEILSKGRRPYPKMSNLDVIRKVEQGHRMPCPAKCPILLHELMLDCWKSQRRERPTFPELVERLTILWQQYAGEGPYSVVAAAAYGVPAVGSAPAAGALYDLAAGKQKAAASQAVASTRYDNAPHTLPFVASEA